MTYRTPYLSVTGPDGTDLVNAWGARLIGVKIVTRFSDEHDECTFTFPDPNIGIRGGMKIRVGEQVRELVTAPDAGYLIQNCVAPGP